MCMCTLLTTPCDDCCSSISNIAPKLTRVMPFDSFVKSTQSLAIEVARACASRPVLAQRCGDSVVATRDCGSSANRMPAVKATTGNKL